MKKITMRHIDNGYYAIAANVAGKLAKASPLGRLPKHGRECLVEYNGKKWWLSRTSNWGKVVWSIREEHKPLQASDFPLKIGTPDIFPFHAR